MTVCQINIKNQVRNFQVFFRIKRKKKPVRNHQLFSVIKRKKPSDYSYRVLILYVDISSDSMD
jgi:hypothetical protein